MVLSTVSNQITILSMQNFQSFGAFPSNNMHRNYVETIQSPSTDKRKKKKKGIARSVPCSSWYQWQQQWSCPQRHKRENNQKGG